MPCCCSSCADGARPRFGRHRDQQMLGADVLVLQTLGFLFGGVRDPPQPRRECDLCTAMRARLTIELGADRAGQRRRIGIELPHERRHDPVLLFEQCEQQVLGKDLGMALAVGELLRRQNGFLCFLGVLVDIHDSYFSILASDS